MSWKEQLLSRRAIHSHDLSQYDVRLCCSKPGLPHVGRGSVVPGEGKADASPLPPASAPPVLSALDF